MRITPKDVEELHAHFTILCGAFPTAKWCYDKGKYIGTLDFVEILVTPPNPPVTLSWSVTTNNESVTGTELSPLLDSARESLIMLIETHLRVLTEGA